MPNNPLDLMTLQDAMSLLGISRATIDRWRKDKGLPHIKIGKEVFIDREQLQQWIARHSHLNPDKHAVAPDPKPKDERVITIGYQSGAALLWSPLIMKELGLLEAELEQIAPSARYQIRWHNAPNGMELVEELIAGRVQIASVGDYPMIASRMLSGLLPRFQPQVIAFDGKTRSGSGISLVVPTASANAQPETLLSKSIAAVGGSSSSYRLKEWISMLGVRAHPIVHRDMGECLNGIIGGQVGASVLWEPYLSWVQSIGAGVPLLSQGMGSDYLTGLIADGNWVKDNEPIVIAYLKAHLRAHAFIRTEPDRAAELIYRSSGFPLPLVRRVLSQIRWDASIYSRDIMTLNRFNEDHSDWLASSKRESGGLAFRKQYLQEAAESLRLPLLPDTPLLGEWSYESIY